MSTAYLFDPIYMEHNTGPGHPERADRLKVINDNISSAPYYKKLIKIKPSLPDIKHIQAIHSKQYVARIERDIKRGISYLDSLDTAVCRKSFDVALYAVGGCLNMCDAVINGKAHNGFCAIRPPGHHAEHDHAAGFCIFNNIAIAARYLQNVHGLTNIAIIDWDVHHGNGTQHSFELDNTIFYISIHQHPHYPGTGHPGETGLRRGEGYNLNIQMRAGASDENYIAAFDRLIIPSLENFNPEIILISAGFDAHMDDPIASIKLSTDAYYIMTRKLIDLAKKFSKKRIIAFLEGGYNLHSLAISVGKVMDALVEG